jgi:hypothetical protein
MYIIDEDYLKNFYLYVFIYIYVFVCMQRYLFVNICTHINSYIHTRIYIYLYSCLHLHIYIQNEGDLEENEIR